MNKVKRRTDSRTSFALGFSIAAIVGLGTAAATVILRTAEVHAANLPTAPSRTAASAEELFRKGLDLAYQGEIRPAVAAFNEGARVDPQCVICLWGLAWTLSSDLDGPVAGERMAEAASALRRARAVSSSPSHRESALVRALETRFDSRTEARGPRREDAYVEQMRQLAREYPADTDILATFAFALISTEEVDHWSAEGRLRPAVREALAVAHQALLMDPGHPGALAVYRHTSEHLKASLTTT